MIYLKKDEEIFVKYADKYAEEKWEWGEEYQEQYDELRKLLFWDLKTREECQNENKEFEKLQSWNLNRDILSEIFEEIVLKVT